MKTTKLDLEKEFQKALELVKKNQSFLLVSHEYTDGDDLGAILALGSVLENLGKKAIMVAKGGIPDNLLFLPGHNAVKEKLDQGEELAFEVLVPIGCSSLGRTGFPELEHWRGLILNLDHHRDTSMYGTVNVWDENSAANCQLLYEMLLAWGIEIDKFLATHLLTGIFTDTGGFRHANVSPKTLEIAAELLRKGAKLNLISRFTFSQKELPVLRAWAMALENARFDTTKQVIYTVITAEDLAKAQASEKDLEGVAELLNTVPEAKFSMLLRQRGDEVKASLRSEPHKGVDVSEIARTFGGGGHKLAAGFKFKGKIERTQEGWKIS